MLDTGTKWEMSNWEQLSRKLSRGAGANSIFCPRGQNALWGCIEHRAASWPKERILTLVWPHLEFCL